MTQVLGFARSSAPVDLVKQVHFGVFSPDEIKRMSMVHITKIATVDAKTGLPVPQGLSDPRLGSADQKGNAGREEDSPGYFGHIELASPVFHVGFLNEIYKLIQCVNITTSELLADKTSATFRHIQDSFTGKKRLREMLKISKVARGDGQPKYRKDGLDILMTFPSEEGVPERKEVLTATKALEVFRAISDEDAQYLGFDTNHVRPEWFIWTVLPVGPPHIRPSVAMGATQRSEDDLTAVYTNILKANTTLQQAKEQGKAQLEIQESEQLLQFHCATLIDNSLPGLPESKQRNGRAFKTIRERLVGKGGRVRGNLMGKRVDFSARSVITGDPTISIDQVGVPRSIAQNLTIPEMVNQYNHARLQRLVDRGPDRHPGAKYIVHRDGRRVDLRFVGDRNQHEAILQHGMIVERHMSDDDIVLFNRQPSLHKMSIMGHKVKVLPYSTFRLNLTCTSPYNADFDGDEMNLHALQTLPAQAEARTLMTVPELIVSPQSNRPVMGIIQDTLLGAFKLSNRGVFVERDMLYNCIMWMYGWNGAIPQPAIMIPRRKSRAGRTQGLWTGKQIFSMFLPKINLRGKSGHFEKEHAQPQALDPVDSIVRIENGELLQGTLDKGVLGARAGGVIHISMNDVHPTATRDFINQVQMVVNYWLQNQGFTVGIGDSEAKPEVMQRISDIIMENKEQVASVLHNAQCGKLKMQPGKGMFDTFESVVNEVLNKARDKAGKWAASTLTPANNNIIAMSSAGSKGSIINISQIIACVGQQNVEGKRIPFGFRDRSLPHFSKFDFSAISRGFVENSYLKGLTPQEFYFHMMGGREGLIDTAVKTAQTGYIQRRLVKAMEDLSVRYDGTVRNARGQIVQFLYGEDGMDGRWIEKQRLPTWELPLKRLRREYGWDPEEPTLGRVPHTDQPYMLDAVRQKIIDEEDVRLQLEAELEQLMEDRLRIFDVFAANDLIKEDTVYLPVPISRIILNVQTKWRIDTVNGISDLDPVHVVQEVNKLCQRCIVVRGTDALSREGQTNATTLFCVLVRATLASKQVIRTYRLTQAAFDDLIGILFSKFNQALVAAGEMCGVLAAQSIGEPTTQMTLNTFHYAGVSAKNVTLGVPRFNELVNVAKQIKTPSVTIFLEAPLKYQDDSFDTLRMRLESLHLHTVVKESSIVYDPVVVLGDDDDDDDDERPRTVVEQDATLVEMWWALADEGQQQVAERASSWLLRLELSLEVMGRSGVTLSQVCKRIRDVIPGVMMVVTGDGMDDVEEDPVIRLRLTPELFPGDDDQDGGAKDDDETLRELEQLLLFDTKLRGLDNIRKLYVRTEDKGQTWTQQEGRHPLPKEQVFDTDGSNLMEILALDDVDVRRTVSNDTVEVLEVLGIEACRALILRELRKVLGAGGGYVNYRHLGLLVDWMTFRGYICAVTRHGINRVDSGPLQRCSFEETVEILFEAAMYSERDFVRGVSENIIFGQAPPMGTGHFELVLDAQALQNAIAVSAQDLARTQLGGEAGDVASPFIVSDDGAQSSYDMGGMTGGMSAMSVDDSLSPGFSPIQHAGGGGVGAMSGSYTPDAGGYTPISPGAASAQYDPGSASYSSAYKSSAGGSYGATSSAYSPTSPAVSQSPAYSPAGTPLGASSGSAAYSPTSPGVVAASPGFQARSPSAATPQYSPTSPAVQASAMSPGYSPTSPMVAGGATPLSPAMDGVAYSPAGGAAGGYSPAAAGGQTPSGGGGGYSPTK